MMAFSLLIAVLYRITLQPAQYFLRYMGTITLWLTRPQHLEEVYTSQSMPLLDVHTNISSSFGHLHPSNIAYLPRTCPSTLLYLRVSETSVI